MKTSETNPVGQALVLFAALSLSVVLLFGASMALLYRNALDDAQTAIAVRERQSVAIAGELIGALFGGLAADLLLLAEQNEIGAWLAGKDGAEAALAAEFRALARHGAGYARIRLLDLDGRERVRVDVRDGQAVAAPEQTSRDQATRDNIKAAVALGPRRVHLSRFTLNIDEDRQVPGSIKPIVEFATPLFDANRRPRGVLMLSVFGQTLIDRVARTARLGPGAMQVLNAEGDWLVAPPGEQAFGFLLNDGERRSFATLHPQSWTRMLAEQQGQFAAGAGLLTYATLDPLGAGAGFGNVAGAAPGGGERAGDFWLLVSQVPAASFVAEQRALLKRLALFATGPFLLTMLGAWFLAWAVARRRSDQALIETMANYDKLTGVANRALLLDRLERVHLGARRYKRCYALLYIDLDGFRQVNERLGLEAGDELLRRVARLLNNSLRRSDTVARMGGDDFCVLLSEVTDAAAAMQIGRKTVAALRAPIRLRAGEVEIGSSVGVALFPDHGDGPEELLKRAIQAMQRARERGSNHCVLATQLAAAADAQAQP